MMTVEDLRIAIAELPDDWHVNILLQGEAGEPPRAVEVDRLSIDRNGMLDVVAARE